MLSSLNGITNVTLRLVSMVDQPCLDPQRQLQGDLGWAGPGTLLAKKTEAGGQRLSVAHRLPAEHASDERPKNVSA